MSNLLNIKDQNGNWIPIPVITNGIQSITQNQDYTLTITLNDGTTYTTTSIKGEDGQDYILTENDKQEIAQDVAELVDTPVDDVQINGASIVTDGVAEIPLATKNTFGVMRPHYGLQTNGAGVIMTYPATDSDIKKGTDNFHQIGAAKAHIATFYGLAKASGDTTQSQSSNPIGIYTPEAKTAIRTMLGLQDVYDDYSSALEALGVI